MIEERIARCGGAEAAIKKTADYVPSESHMQ